MSKKLAVLMTVIAITLTSVVAGMKNPIVGGQRMTEDTLLEPENRATLTKVLTYHVVSGRLSASDLKQQIKAGNGITARRQAHHAEG